MGKYRTQKPNNEINENKIESSEKNCEELRFPSFCLGVNEYGGCWLFAIECQIRVSGLVLNGWRRWNWSLYVVPEHNI